MDILRRTENPRVGGSIPSLGTTCICSASPAHVLCHSGPAAVARGIGLSCLNHFSDSIRGYRFEDVPPIFLAPGQGLGKVPRLLGRNVTWERRLSLIHDSLNDSWSAMGQSLV